MDYDKVRGKAASSIARLVNGSFLMDYHSILYRWSITDLALIDEFMEQADRDYETQCFDSVVDDSIHITHGYGNCIVVESQPLRVDSQEVEDLLKGLDLALRGHLLDYYKVKVLRLVDKQKMSGYVEDKEGEEIVLAHGNRKLILKFLEPFYRIQVTMKIGVDGADEAKFRYIYIDDSAGLDGIVDLLGWLAYTAGSVT